MKDLFAIVEQAGLTITQAAEILGVTVPTMYNWKNGRVPRSKTIIMQVTKIKTAMKLAVEQGLLPLSEDAFKPAERVPAIKKALVVALTK